MAAVVVAAEPPPDDDDDDEDADEDAEPMVDDEEDAEVDCIMNLLDDFFWLVPPVLLWLLLLKLDFFELATNKDVSSPRPRMFCAFLSKLFPFFNQFFECDTFKFAAKFLFWAAPCALNYSILWQSPFFQKKNLIKSNLNAHNFMENTDLTVKFLIWIHKI